MTKKPIRHAIQDNTYNPTYKSEFIEVFDGYEWVLQEVRREILPSDEVDDQEETRGTQPSQSKISKMNSENRSQNECSNC